MNLWMSNVANNCPYSCVCSSIFHVVVYLINNIEILLYISHWKRGMENGLVYSSNLKVYIIALTS